MVLPNAKFPEKVGSYPALTKSGGGYFWDEVLEYRVWLHPELGAEDPDGDGGDYFYSFCTFQEALAFSTTTAGAEAPLVLIFQEEHINEPSPGVFEHVKENRITEWQCNWLEGSKRENESIEQFLQEHSNLHPTVKRPWYSWWRKH